MKKQRDITIAKLVIGAIALAWLLYGVVSAIQAMLMGGLYAKSIWPQLLTYLLFMVPMAWFIVDASIEMHRINKEEKALKLTETTSDDSTETEEKVE